MSLKECYDKMGADYEDVLSRLRSEVLVRKFALKFLDDDSYANLKATMESGNAPEAFRGAHTLIRSKVRLAGHLNGAVTETEDLFY